MKKTTKSTAKTAKPAGGSSPKPLATRSPKKTTGRRKPSDAGAVSPQEGILISAATGTSLPHEIEMVALGASIPPLYKCSRTAEAGKCIKLYYNRVTGRWDLPQGGVVVDCSTCTHFFGE